MSDPVSSLVVDERQVRDLAEKRIRAGILEYLGGSLQKAKVMCFPGGADLKFYHDLVDNTAGLVLNCNGESRLDDIEGELRRGRFDVVCLDYTNLGMKQDIVNTYPIALRRALSDRSVLHTRVYDDRAEEFISTSARSLEAVTGTITSPRDWNPEYAKVLSGLGGDGVSSMIAGWLMSNFHQIDTYTRRKNGDNTKEKTQVMGEEESYKELNRLAGLRAKPYFIRELKRFSYVLGDRVILEDIFLVDNAASIIERTRVLMPYFRDLRERGLLESPDGKEVVKKVRAQVSAFKSLSLDSRVNTNPWKLPKREDITPREELDAGRTVQLIKSGWTDSMFYERLKGATPEVVQGYRNRLARGEYDKPADMPVRTAAENGREREKIKLENGVFVFDSNSHRLRTTVDRMDFAGARVDYTNLLNGHAACPGLKMRKKPASLYVLNGHDIQASAAFDELVTMFGDTELNLVVIGSGNDLADNIRTAEELGVKLKVSRVISPSPYLDAAKPVRLEEVLAAS